MKRKKLITMEVTVSVPVGMSLRDARREVRTLINHQANWAADERDIRVQSVRPFPDDDDDEIDEVARPVAINAELLAALERAIPHIGVGYSGIQRESVMKDVRAAIAKARGDDKSRAAAHYQEQARLLSEEKED